MTRIGLAMTAGTATVAAVVAVAVWTSGGCERRGGHQHAPTLAGPEATAVPTDAVILLGEIGGESGTAVVRSLADLVELLRARAADGADPHARAHAVVGSTRLDFSRRMLVAVFRRCPGPGYGVRITSVQRFPDRLRVGWQPLGRGAPKPGTPVTVYQALSVEHSDLPVDFAEDRPPAVDIPVLPGK